MKGLRTGLVTALVLTLAWAARADGAVGAVQVANARAASSGDNVSAGATAAFRIEAQDLGDALNAFAVQAGQEILFVADEIAGKTSVPVVGRFTPAAALEQLLTGSGLPYRINDLDTILVGSRIKVLTGESTSANVMTADAATTQSTRADALAAPVKSVGTRATDPVGAMEEVVVTGIRGSLLQSLARKRAADHFVDVITAEDIGSFPDQNLAEALQRISGVAIDRREGEGRFVSVRGLGPEFVQTTTNGRVVASNVVTNEIGASVAGSSHFGERAIGFDQFQSGLVQAVEVSKSPRADHVEGGLGGMIEIQARRPVDLGKRYVAFNVDLEHNRLAGEEAPGAFVLFINLFAGGTLGFMVSAEWDRRTNRADSVNHPGYFPTPRTYDVGGQIVTGYHSAQYRGFLDLADRERLNLSSSFQWLPSNRVNLTVDMLHTENTALWDQFWRDFRLGNGLATGITSAVTLNDHGTPVFSTLSTDTSALFLQHADQRLELENTTFGTSMAVQATDRLSFDFDVSISDTRAPVTYRISSCAIRRRRPPTTDAGRAGCLHSLRPTRSPIRPGMRWSRWAGRPTTPPTRLCNTGRT